MPNRASINRALYGSPSTLIGRPRSILGAVTSALGVPIVAAANLPYQPYLPNPEFTEPFGLDLSMYNWGGDLKQEPDWEMLARYAYPKIEFIYYRMGISWGYIDPTFERSWKAIKQYTDISRSPYHVIYVSQSIARQLENIERGFDLVGGDMGEGPIIEDWELHNNQEPVKVSTQMGRFVEEGENYFQRRIDIYSGDWFIKAFGVEQPWMADVLWLMAHYAHPTYGEHPGPPAKPAIIPRNKIAWHQTGSYFDGRVMGIPGNIRVDGNRLQSESGLTIKTYMVGEIPEPPTTPSSDKVLDFNLLMQRRNT
jgi:GH25 family lysozyme M1 (1,4-beta-N-acetylmuramidase)